MEEIPPDKISAKGRYVFPPRPCMTYNIKHALNSPATTGSSSISEPADGTASISENETEQERARKEEEVRSVEQEVAKRNEEDRLIRSQPAPERKKAIAAAQHRRRLWEQSLPPSPSSGATTITASAMSTPSGAAPSRSNIAR